MKKYNAVILAYPVSKTTNCTKIKSQTKRNCFNIETLMQLI